jgi:hypothetical protein
VEWGCPLDSNQFAQTVKQKYPQYAQVPNDVLTQKIVQKYPQYAKAITPSAPQMPQQPAQRPPQQGLGQMDPNALLQAYSRADPQGAQQLLTQLMGSKFGPGPSQLQQSEAAKNFAQAQRYQNPTQQKTPASVWMNPNDPTDISPTAKDGYIEYKTSSGDALNKFTGNASAKARNNAMARRNEAWNRSIDNKQIDSIAKSTGLTTKNLSAIQNNQLRAARATEILSQPKITWQELALGDIDLAGIMQGGVPQVDEVKATHFPGWQENWSKWKTYATGHPDESVPPDIQKKVRDLVNGVTQIDNRFIQSNAMFQKKMLGPTIRGGLGQNRTQTIDQMTNDLSLGGDKKPDADTNGWSIQKVQ